MDPSDDQIGKRVLQTPDDPYDPEDREIHAGKVFVISQSVLEGVSATASDGSAATMLKDSLLLCLWDLVGGGSIWIGVQSVGEYEIPHEQKYLRAGSDPNWMDSSYVSKYRDGTIWLLGGRGRGRFKYGQKEQRGVSLSVLD